MTICLIQLALKTKQRNEYLGTLAEFSQAKLIYHHRESMDLPARITMYHICHAADHEYSSFK